MSVSPKRPRGPHLNAMRAFEAAARLESFSAAAEELSVTPGAISQHIKALEDWTGTALFLRGAQGVRLSTTGRALLPAFEQAFDALGDAVRQVQSVRPIAEFHIATLPSIAQLWLSPRLPKIRAVLGDARLSVTAIETPPNLSRELFDVSIFLKEPSGGANEVVLAKDRIFPVCAPALAASLTTPADLLDVPLLFDRSWKSDWDNWTTSLGLPQMTGAYHAEHSLYGLAVEEARNGAGVLIGHDCLLRQDLDAGRLVAPFDHVCDTGKALVLDFPSGIDTEFVKRLVEVFQSPA